MRKKINWLLILQGWTMLWVVIGHAPLESVVGGGNPLYVSILFDFAYSFHMALFIMISGWLFYLTRLNSEKWSYKKTIGEKLVRLGIPYVVFTIVAMVVKTIFASDMSRPSSVNIGYFLRAIVDPANGPLNEMWFVMVIMLCFALMPLWKWVIKYKCREIVMLILLVVLHFIPVNVEWLCMDAFCRRVIWFYVGVLLCKYELLDKIQARWILVILCGVMVYALSVCVKFSFTMALGGIILSVGIAFALDKYVPKIFLFFRDYTYQIFLMGIFVQIFVKMLYKHIHLPYTPVFLLCIIAGLYLPIVVSKILEKINFGPLLVCIGLKKKINKQK